jgi:thioredoxin-related protein
MRKRYFLWFILLHLGLFAQTPAGFETLDHATALKKSTETGKPILYFLYASWCPHCHVMRDQVLPDEAVQASLKKGFIPIAIDGESDFGRKLMRKYNQSSYPVFVFLNGKDELLYGFTGEVKKDNLLRELQVAGDPDNQLPTLIKAFSADPTNSTKCLKLVQTLRKARQDASPVAHKYFKSVPDDQMVSANNWMIFANGIQDINSREVRFVLANQKEFAGVSSPKRVERKLVNLVQELLRPLVEKQDSTAYLQNRNLAKMVTHRAADSAVFAFDLKLWETTKNWNRYRLALRENARSYYWEYPEKLKDAAQILFKNADDEPSQLLASDLAKRSVELKPAMDGYLLLARIHEKKGDRKKAAEWAESARDFAAKLDFPTSEADEILKRNL